MKTAKIFKSLESLFNFEQRLASLENLLNGNDEGVSRNKLFASVATKEKCKSIYTKVELAHLFYFLMEEGILFFDLVDNKSNRSKFQKFIMENFTYAGDKGIQTEITSISKQFSECKGFSYKEKYILSLEKLLLKLQERKIKLEKW